MIPVTTPCRSCDSDLAPGLLSCPSCGTLVHSSELQRLAGEARQAGTPADELAAWRQALQLLPPDSRQFEVIREMVDKLCREIDHSTLPGKTGSTPGNAKRAGITGGLLAAIAFLAKFKFALLFLLTKAKLLVLGLTKAGTLLSMLASFGVYWAAWGWKFAAALIGSIYVHEMGHVSALRRFGIKASAPMFLPGLGAVVRLREALHSPIEDARVGLAGPIWGLGAAVFAWGLAMVTSSPFWTVIAGVGAWINLFNLIPVWQLDGSRAFRAMNRLERGIAATAIGVMFVVTSEHLLLLLLIAAIFRLFGKEVPAEGDRRTLFEYIALVCVLSALTIVLSHA